MDFFKIKNNTSNSIIINGTYIAGNSEMILSEEVVSSIDSKYFDADLLVNLGKSQIEETYIMINNKNNNSFYKKPPSGIPKTHLDREVNLSLKKADNSLQKGKVQIDDLGLTLVDILKNMQSSQFIETKESSDSIVENSSVVIKEKQLEKTIRDALQDGRDAYQILQDKIGYEQLTSEVQYILDIANENIRVPWKDPVTMVELLPLLDNTNGDVRLVLNENSLYRWNANENSWNPLNSSETSPNPDIPDGSVPTPIIRTRLILGEFFADQGQQIFQLQDSYIVGSDDLQVLLNGILLIRDEDYIEVDERTIQMIFPLIVDDYVVFSVSHSDLVPYVVVEKHVVSESGQRTIMLNKAIGNNASILQIFLNGVAVSLGEDKDYLIYESKYVRFNYDLEDGDIIIARFETSSLADNFELQFAQMQRVYMNISKQIQDLRERVEDKF